MNKQQMIAWLHECARYFEHRPTHGEDSEFWANVMNAENARNIAAYLEHGEDGRSLENPFHRVVPDDMRDPGMFVYHRCWKCNDGAKPCVNGRPRQCEYPRARND